MSTRVDISVILDRSGSTMGISADLQGGFDSFIAEQRKVADESGARVTVSLYQFDNEYETVYSRKPLKDVPPLVHNPRSATALHDAIGRTIDAKGIEFRKMPKARRPDKVLFLIMTDGHENASVEYSGNKVKSMVQHQQEKYAWDFVFIGANQDAVLTAQHLGISYAMNWVADAAGTERACGTMSSSIGSYISNDAHALDSLSVAPKDSNTSNTNKVA